MRVNTTLYWAGKTSSLTCGIWLALALGALPVRAQEFGDEPADEPAAEAEEPAAAPAPRRGAQPARPVVPESQDPAVRAVLESQPTTPSQLLRAIINLVDLGEPVRAEEYLDKLIAKKLNRPALATLAREFGTPEFLRLTRVKALQPKIAKFVDDVTLAADQQSRDPKRLASLVPPLRSRDPHVRRAAIVDLMEGKEDAVTHLISVLADPARTDDHLAVQQALVELGNIAIDPLHAALKSDDERFQTLVIETLGDLGATRSALYLVGPAAAGAPAVRSAANESLARILGAKTTPATTAKFLQDRIDRYLGGAWPVKPDHEGMVVVWSWDPKTRTTTAQKFPADDVGVLLSAQLTRDLYHLQPTNPAYRRLYLTTELEAAKIRFGFEKPLAEIAADAYRIAREAGPAAVQDLLQFALSSGKIDAATAACEILGEIASPEDLGAPAGRVSPLVQALGSSDPRLRYAALAAIMKINPRYSYPGASSVPAALGDFAALKETTRAKSADSPRRSAAVAPPAERTRGQITAAEREQQAIQALKWLGELAAGKQRLYDLQHQVPAVEAALFIPALAPTAAETLAKFSTDRGQRALVRLVGLSTFPRPARQAATMAFTRSVAEHGLLLTTKEISAQYERYNASEGEDAETQELLALVLDTIEARRPLPPPQE